MSDDDPTLPGNGDEHSSGAPGEHAEEEPFEPEPMDPRNIEGSDWAHHHDHTAHHVRDLLRHPWALAGAGISILALVFLVVPRVLGGGTDAPNAPTGGEVQMDPNRPDFVIINTDDQRWDTLKHMPIVRKQLGAKGVTFTEAVVTNPVCCPSRASLLTGTYSHTNKVWDNNGANGGFRAFNAAGSIATYLDVGYTTAMFGKYLNHYETAAREGVIPLGWDHWFAFDKLGYFDYKVNDNGKLRRYGRKPEDYSTTVFTDEIVSFIRQTEGPLMVYFAPAAPHYPVIADPQDEKRFRNIPNWRPRSYDEEDVSDKPEWVRHQPRIGPHFADQIDEFRRDQLRSLQAVDRSVGRIVEALEETGRLENTMIVFTSDNGMVWGEHRFTGKNAAYEESIRVPMVVRFDRMVKKPGASSNALVANIDITPTMVALAGTRAPRADGRSFAPLLRSPQASWRETILIEHWAAYRTERIPSYCAVRTGDMKYVDYGWGKDELYDLQRDPMEMTNLIDDAGYRGALGKLAAERRKLCNPGPPKSGVKLADQVAAGQEDGGPF